MKNSLKELHILTYYEPHKYYDYMKCILQNTLSVNSLIYYSYILQT